MHVTASTVYPNLNVVKSSSEEEFIASN